MDRRQYARYRVNLYTQIITPKFYISINTIEISIEGIRIEAYSEIPPGTEVTITFDLDKKNPPSRNTTGMPVVFCEGG